MTPDTFKTFEEVNDRLGKDEYGKMLDHADGVRRQEDFMTEAEIFRNNHRATHTIIEPVGEPESGLGFQQALQESRGAAAITFTRPDPTKFVLLTCRVGPGTGTVLGTENFKPTGTEWATERDMEDAGYIQRDLANAAFFAVERALRVMETEFAEALVCPVTTGDGSTLRGETEQALDRLRERIRGAASKVKAPLLEAAVVARRLGLS